MTIPPPTLPRLDTSTIVPSDASLYLPYFYQLYQDIASNVNNRDYTFFPVAISDVPSNIPTMAQFGSFVICVSGIAPDPNDGSTPPTLTAALNKSSRLTAGVINVLGSQAGQETGIWTGKVLTITSTASNFQIAHNLTGVTAGFNIRYIGTQ